MSTPRSKKTTRPKPFVFVLMPFEKAFENVYHTIQYACVRAETYAERVDKQIFQESILERIYNQIAKADVVVADMSERNPNVFYETGYAHALGKTVILLTQRVDDIPFDLRHYPHIIYGTDHGPDLPHLDRELSKRIERAVELPNAFADNQRHLRLEVQGKKLQGKPTIVVTPKGKRGTDLELILNVQNSVEEVIRTAEFKLALLTSDALSNLRASQASRGASPGAPAKVYSTSTIRLESGVQCLHLIRDRFVLMPGEWESLRLDLSNSRQRETEEVAFQVLMDTGARSHPCVLRIET